MTLRARDDQGATAVETALVIPILLLLIFGLFEIGRLTFSASSVVLASREAARYGTTTGEGVTPATPRYADCAGVRDAAQAIPVFASPADDEIVITYIRPDDTTFDGCGQPNLIESGDRVSVTITVPFSPVVGLTRDFLPTSISRTTTRTITK